MSSFIRSIDRDVHTFDGTIDTTINIIEDVNSVRAGGFVNQLVQLYRAHHDLDRINIPEIPFYDLPRFPITAITENVSFNIEKVIFNNPATIVYWEDGTKTVVRCGENDVFDEEKGLALCFMKKALKNKGNYNNVLKKHTQVVDKEKKNG